MAERLPAWECQNPLWRQKSKQRSPVKARGKWTWGSSTDQKEAQENFWVVALGLELLSAGYTWVYVFVKTDVYT